MQNLLRQRASILAGGDKPLTGRALSCHVPGFSRHDPEKAEPAGFEPGRKPAFGQDRAANSKLER
jgi:hypothetical protein